jgi:hypothetical protein
MTFDLFSLHGPAAGMATARAEAGANFCPRTDCSRPSSMSAYVVEHPASPSSVGLRTCDPRKFTRISTLVN